MRGIRVLRNVVTNYLRLILTAGVALVLTPLMVRGLGDRDYGLWTTVFSLTGYFGLFDQGIRPSLVRYVSRDHAVRDYDGLSRTISSAIALYTGVGVLTMVFAAFVGAHAADWIRMDPELHAVAPTLVLLVGATLALGFPLGVFGAVLSGLQRYDVANGIGMVISLVRPVAFVGVLKAGGGLVELAWASLVVNLLGHVWSWWAARGLLPEVTVSPALVSRAHLRRIASYGGWALTGALAQNLSFQTDALVITSFVGAALVTPFSLGAGLVDNARSLVHGAAFVLSPTASEMDTLGEREKLRHMLLSGSRYSVLVSWPVLMGLVVFGGNLLETWVGAKYANAAVLITTLAIPTMISLPQAIASSLLFGISRHKGVVLLSLASALVNLGLSVWWANHPGLLARWVGDDTLGRLLGVALGTALPQLVLSGLATAAFACHVLELPFARYLWQGLLQPGLVACAFLPLAIAAQAVWRPMGWLPIFGVCAAGWLVFAAAAWHWGIPHADRPRWARMVGGLVRPAVPEGGKP
ncbi:MAG: oligosaccharide flippase family protein [Candidatus Eisenbacteria bacterium]